MGSDRERHNDNKGLERGGAPENPVDQTPDPGPDCKDIDLSTRTRIEVSLESY